METAQEYGIPLPAAAVETQLFNSMVQLGWGDMDNSAVLGIIEMLAGETLRID